MIKARGTAENSSGEHFSLISMNFHEFTGFWLSTKFDISSAFPRCSGFFFANFLLANYLIIFLTVSTSQYAKPSKKFYKPQRNKYLFILIKKPLD